MKFLYRDFDATGNPFSDLVNTVENIDLKASGTIESSSVSSFNFRIIAVPVSHLI